MLRDWNEHYANPANIDWDPEPLLVEAGGYLGPGRALDLASGPGRNAIYLAQLGWEVTAVDSSATAIRLLRGRAQGLPVDPRVADLESGEFEILPDTYDLICDFFYLQSSLFPAIRAGVRPGGMVAAAIHITGGGHETEPYTGKFRLEPGRLREEFAGWKILYYSEGAERGRSRRTARILARRA
jgi:tellurite methyltransferase